MEPLLWTYAVVVNAGDNIDRRPSAVITDINDHEKHANNGIVSAANSVSGSTRSGSRAPSRASRGSLLVKQPAAKSPQPRMTPAVPVEPLVRLPRHAARLPHADRVQAGSNVSLNKLDKDLTSYAKALELLAKDPNLQKEVNLGKRVGFYKLGRELGSGNFSKVRLGMHVLAKEKVAVKIMERSKMDQKAIRLLNREVQNMEETHHPNVIRLFEVVETLSKMYLVLEYAGGGELYSYVLEKERLADREAARIFAQVCAATIHMHQKGIIHRDIKAENVFFAGPNWVKLGDFGFSVAIETGTFLKTFCGSPPYAAPELFKDEEYLGEYVDIWALGVLLYFLLVGNTPFRGDTVADLKRQILDGFFMVPDYVSPFAQDLINGILQMDPKKRYNFGELMFNSQRCDKIAHRMSPESYRRSKRRECKSALTLSPNAAKETEAAQLGDSKPQSKSAVAVTGGVTRPLLCIQDHYWLNRCRFPESDVYVSPYPNEDELKSCPLAPVVFDRLAAFGITAAMLKDAVGKGAKNSVVGVYRIITYAVQREDAEKRGTRNPIPQHNEDDEALDDGTNVRATFNKKNRSKMCAIL